MIYVGIDPGDNGAVAILRSKEHMPVVLSQPVQGPRYRRLGADVAQMLKLIEGLNSDRVVIICEKAISIRGRKTSGTVVVGRHVRAWKYVASKTKSKFVEVSPRTWQASLLEKGDTKAQARAYCESAWGRLTQEWTPDECDAACIAVWGLDNNKGE